MSTPNEPSKEAMEAAKQLNVAFVPDGHIAAVIDTAFAPLRQCLARYEGGAAGKGETPMTDAVIQQTYEDHLKRRLNDPDHYFELVEVLSKHARQLERELSDFKQALEIANRSADDQMQQKRAAERDLATVRAERDQYVSALTSIKDRVRSDEDFSADEIVEFIDKRVGKYSQGIDWIREQVIKEVNAENVELRARIAELEADGKRLAYALDFPNEFAALIVPMRWTPHKDFNYAMWRAAIDATLAAQTAPTKRGEAP